MDIAKIKLVAMDLDGTLTQHKQSMSAKTRSTLDKLSQNYKLVMVGAGQVMRIFNQMEHYPLDIIGNYGLQWGKYNEAAKNIDMVRDLSFDCDRPAVEEKVSYFRQKYGYTEYRGDSVEYHPSGCITFPLLGTKAEQADKLAFDPDRAKRRKIYDEVSAAFDDYCVFVGGSSSFDMAPKPYNKYYALDMYCKENKLLHENAVFIGDDYGIGGNDESVYKSDFNFITIDNYEDFSDVVSQFLKNTQLKPKLLLPA